MRSTEAHSESEPQCTTYIVIPVTDFDSRRDSFTTASLKRKKKKKMRIEGLGGPFHSFFLSPLKSMLFGLAGPGRKNDVINVKVNSEDEASSSLSAIACIVCVSWILL
jgi:hypothetical protein